MPDPLDPSDPSLPTDVHRPYLAGLVLAGRKVVVVGGGHVAQRRCRPSWPPVRGSPWSAPRSRPPSRACPASWPSCCAASRTPTSTAPGTSSPPPTTPRSTPGSSPPAERRHTFCVRADDALGGTAWTPAAGHHGSVTVGVLGNREPHRSAALRDEIVTALRDGHLHAVDAHDRTPGVVLVGGGPGEPELATVAARHALASADVVVADRLAPRELLDELGPHVELVDVAKLPRGRSATQERINEVIVERARAGKRVVRFKGGDNFVFGRGYEEVLACLEADVPVTVVPGLTSAIAVPARAGIPVTHRGVAHEFTVISGHLPPGHPQSLVAWDAVARMRGTVVLLMAVENAPAIAEALVSGGRAAATPVAVVVDGTMPTERTVLTTLEDLASDLAAHEVSPPAIIVVGEVVAVARPAHYGRG